MAWNEALQWTEEELSVNTAACSLAISFGSVMVVSFFPFRYCLGGQMFLLNIFLTLSHTLYRSLNWQLWYIFCPWLAFVLVEESPSLRLWPSERRYAFPSRSPTLSSSLVQGPPSLQGFPAFFIKPGFDFLGMLVALGMQSFAALVMCSTHECKGSASSSISSEMPSTHASWNCSQLALGKKKQ